MALYLGILLFSFIFTAIAIVPFIDLLYRLQFTYSSPIPPSSRLESKEFSEVVKSQSWKIGTPIGGGLLIIGVVCVLFSVIFPSLGRFGVYISSNFNLKEELNVIFFTFISFGLVGLFEDINKIFRPAALLPKSTKTWLQIILAAISAFMIYQNLGLSILNIPYFGVIRLGFLFVPLATLVIFIFTRSFDITDGLDGLASGTLLICLLAFWAVSLSSLDSAISVFIALWIGSLLAFLYFNIYPARIWLGNAGSLSFGATLAVTALLLGKTVALFVIGGIFTFEVIFQILHKGSVHFLGKKLLPVTPIHYWLFSLGWPEPKIVLRSWIIAIMLAVLGLWISPV